MDKNGYTKMPNYQLAKVYKVVSDKTDQIYIGSTCYQFLSKRLGNHQYSFRKGINKCTITNILKYGDAKIVLLEKCPCVDKHELAKIERKYIESLTCVNRQIPGRTRQEYYLANKEKIKEANRLYKLNNKEQVKQYRENYKIKHAERLKLDSKKRTICECGKDIMVASKARHCRSHAHIKLLENL